MGLMPSQISPKQKIMLGVAVVVLLGAGYLIYDNLRGPAPIPQPPQPAQDAPADTTSAQPPPPVQQGGSRRVMPPK